jgi:hypothetical protein
VKIKNSKDHTNGTYLPPVNELPPPPPRVHSSACSTDTTEEYYIKRDEFMRHIAFEVNPARLASGLSEIREHEARECYRIITDFQRKWNEPSSNVKVEAER